MVSPHLSRPCPAHICAAPKPLRTLIPAVYCSRRKCSNSTVPMLICPLALESAFLAPRPTSREPYPPSAWLAVRFLIELHVSRSAVKSPGPYNK